jgi:hypothetical protein
MQDARIRGRIMPINMAVKEAIYRNNDWIYGSQKRVQWIYCEQDSKFSGRNKVCNFGVSSVNINFSTTEHKFSKSL